MAKMILKKEGNYIMIFLLIKYKRVKDNHNDFPKKIVLFVCVLKFSKNFYCVFRVRCMIYIKNGNEKDEEKKGGDKFG